MLEKLFKLRENGSNVRTEVLAGVTTFLTMAYIIFVNPMMMADAGIDPGAAFVATCLAAAIGSLVMGLWANYPIALAPGMGLNAFFSYTVVGSMGYSWQVALGAVFLSGFLFFLLSLFRIREWIINSIPLPLRSAIAAGIGLFLWELELGNSVESARTIAVNAVVMCEIFYLFNSRSLLGPVLSREGLLGNPAVPLTIALCLVLQLLFTYAPPLQGVFGSESMSADEWLRVLLAGVTLFVVAELEKCLVRRCGLHARAT